MVKKIFLIAALSVFASLLKAQQEEIPDAKAKAVIEALSKKAKTYKTIKADFTIVVYDRNKQPGDPQKGSLCSKGAKYRLDIKSQTVICDSATTWTYLKDANEVQINNVESDPDKGNISPATIFTIYEKGFKSHWDGETKNGAETMEVIDLYPKHPEREKYHTLKLTINKEKDAVEEILVMMKDGTTVKYTVNSFSPNTTLSPGTFTFNSKDYPGVEVEDLRN